MDFAHDERTRSWRLDCDAFLVEHVYPAEPVLNQQVEEARGTDRQWSRPPVVEAAQGGGAGSKGCGTCSCPAPARRRADERCSTRRSPS